MPRLICLLMLVACSDYNLKPDPVEVPGETGAPLIPDVAADPDVVELGPVCGDGDADITLRNDGTGDLHIDSLVVDGAGWTVDDSALPVTLAPGESVTVALTGQGDATLEVGSDDPDEPLLSIPVSASEDQPPTVEILAPTHEQILESGDLTLLATVSDDVDPPDTLALTWTASVDGVISTAPADSDGNATATWADGRTEGNQDLDLLVTDSCGLSASADVGVCQQGGYEVNELDIDAWHFEGATVWDSADGWLILTPNLGDQVGTAFETAHAVDGSNVDIEFLFYIGDGTGADGLSLTALDVDRMSTFLGGTGCGIGYGGDAACTDGPALPGWSIEVDTWYNAESDPTEDDHLAFTFDGDVDDPAVWKSLPEMEDTGWHTMSVTVVAPHLTVVIDGTTYIDQDLTGNFSFPAYVGFTAGTGGMTNRHMIESLQVTEYVCE